VQWVARLSVWVGWLRELVASSVLVASRLHATAGLPPCARPRASHRPPWTAEHQLGHPSDGVSSAQPRRRERTHGKPGCHGWLCASREFVPEGRATPLDRRAPARPTVRWHEFGAAPTPVNEPTAGTEPAVTSQVPPSVRPRGRATPLDRRAPARPTVRWREFSAAPTPANEPTAGTEPAVTSQVPPSVRPRASCHPLGPPSTSSANRPTA